MTQQILVEFYNKPNQYYQVQIQQGLDSDFLRSDIEQQLLDQHCDFDDIANWEMV